MALFPVLTDLSELPYFSLNHPRYDTYDIFQQWLESSKTGRIQVKIRKCWTSLCGAEQKTNLPPERYFWYAQEIGT